MWVFGYGSLIWKVDFPVKRQLTGHIKGYLRRFWQGSTDHRGVPGNPGRVVTLVPATETDHVWGVAFEIPEEHAEAVRCHLDHREKGGFTVDTVTFFPEDHSQSDFMLKVYIATETNPEYLGPADLDAMAKQIYQCVGPSGKNMDYLLNLAQALRTLLPNVEDPHLSELEQRVLEMEQRSNGHIV